MRLNSNSIEIGQTQKNLVIGFVLNVASFPPVYCFLRQFVLVKTVWVHGIKYTLRSQPDYIIEQEAFRERRHLHICDL